MRNSASQPTIFGAALGEGGEGLGESCLVSGGGDGLLVSRGLGSPPSSSRGRFEDSGGFLFVTSPSLGPWLVPLSSNRRFKPFSPPSDLLLVRVCIAGADFTPLSAYSVPKGVSLSVASCSTGSCESLSFTSVITASSTSEVFSSTSAGGASVEIIGPGACWSLSKAFGVFQLRSSTPWLICLTLILISWRGETPTPMGGDTEWDRDRDREEVFPVPSSTSSFVDSNVRLLRFAGVRVSRDSVVPVPSVSCEEGRSPSG